MEASCKTVCRWAGRSLCRSDEMPVEAGLNLELMHGIVQEEKDAEAQRDRERRRSCC